MGWRPARAKQLFSTSEGGEKRELGGAGETGRGRQRIGGKGREENRRGGEEREDWEGREKGEGETGGGRETEGEGGNKGEREGHPLILGDIFQLSDYSAILPNPAPRRP